MKERRKEERKSCTSYNKSKDPHLAAGEGYKNLNPRNSLVWLVSWHKKAAPWKTTRELLSQPTWWHPPTSRADAAWTLPSGKGCLYSGSGNAATPLPRVLLWRLPLRVADTLWAGQVAEPFRDVCKTVQHALATLRLRFNQGPQAFLHLHCHCLWTGCLSKKLLVHLLRPVHALEAKSTSGSCLRTYPVYSKSLGLSTRGLPRLPQKRKASSEMGTSLVV